VGAVEGHYDGAKVSRLSRQVRNSQFPQKEMKERKKSGQSLEERLILASR